MREERVRGGGREAECGFGCRRGADYFVQMKYIQSLLSALCLSFPVLAFSAEAGSVGVVLLSCMCYVLYWNLLADRLREDGATQ